MTTRAERQAAPAIRAVVDACAGIGLAGVEPRVLGIGANVVLHLAPHPVVARIATLTAEMRGGAVAYLRREREITAALERRGHPVIGPTDLVDPGPHESGGHAFVLLRHQALTPVDHASAGDAIAAGRALVQLTTALADLPEELAVDDVGHPWAEMAALAAALADHVDPEAARRIDEVAAHLRRTEPQVDQQLVHGDAHRTNVAHGPGGIVWFDFEDANRRPLAWDLASLLRSWPAAGREACRLAGVEPEDEVMRWHHEFREVYALRWSLLYASRDDRVAPAATARLQAWLERTRQLG